jgi:hypothetical protein
MVVHFIDAKTKLMALAKLPIAPCKIVKVCGGYLWFDTMIDYEIWRRSK